jgi:YHS domain-containing protein/thiol-disulfide isomerase/thioredoxin
MRPVIRLSGAVCFLTALVSFAAAQEPIQWQPSLEAAQRLAAQSNRLVLIHFWAPWCKPCLNMEKTVFSQEETGRALEANFVLVKLNADDSPSTAKMYQVSSLPTDVIITSNGRLVAAIQSPPTAAMYVAQMNRAADGFKQLNQSPHSGMVRTTTPQNPYGAAVTDPAQNGGAPAQAPAAMAATQPSTDHQYAEFAQAGGGAMVPAAAAAMSSAQSGQSPAAMSAPAATTPAPAAAGGNPVGLDGFCPVTLIENKRWVQGDARWGAIHRGRTYLFANQEAQRRFLANPDAYSPVIQGNDPVLALDGRQAVAGHRAHGLIYEKRVYLFSSEDSLKQFQQNPKRYAAEIIQAMR